MPTSTLLSPASPFRPTTRVTPPSPSCSNPQVHEILKSLNQLIPPASRDVEDIQLVLLKEKILEDEPKFLN
ncbi:E3 ubiquitin-protein ligase UPL4 isoform X1 [Iris pallida]|uniref:E3 ubiquitin-protein ligase UPL4 isoform X1 n=1 Tax=Iris pallida TaxID=29817 RepID=A0AAX6G707_IRIPA|nr:E3 ubiquitin-protein ligase UPL4 isoform X1 [Iris pallida]KAJ6824525.1 E3 ubiquitin-protein ligase UPL4 isoform X1 [Iris pallida]